MATIRNKETNSIRFLVGTNLRLVIAMSLETLVLGPHDGGCDRKSQVSKGRALILECTGLSVYPSLHGFNRCRIKHQWQLHGKGCPLILTWTIRMNSSAM